MRTGKHLGPRHATAFWGTRLFNPFARKWGGGGGGENYGQRQQTERSDDRVTKRELTSQPGKASKIWDGALGRHQDGIVKPMPDQQAVDCRRNNAPLRRKTAQEGTTVCTKNRWEPVVGHIDQSKARTIPKFFSAGQTASEPDCQDAFDQMAGSFRPQPRYIN